MKRLLPFLILILIGLVPLLDLFNLGLPVTHDGQDHVVRIANFYQNLKEGNIIPRWGGNLNWGYGHPVLMFLYPLPSYLSSLVHVAGISLVDSIKIVLGTTFVLSGITMYIWTRNFLPQYAAFFSAILYMFAPYRFVDLYVRGALGEHVAFVFPPLIFYFILKLSKKYSGLYVIGGSLSFAGLLLSHNAISIMFMPIIALYCFYLVGNSSFNKRLIINMVYTLLLGFGLSSFFLLPAFFEGKYTLRDIVTSQDYRTRFVEIKDLVFSKWSYGISGQFSAQVGIVHWFVTILSVPLALSFYQKKSNLWIFTCGLLLILLAALFLMHGSSVLIWDKISTLQKFQFPWRFLSVVVFASSVLGGILVSQILKQNKIVIILLIFAVLFINKEYWKAKEHTVKKESFYTGIYSGTTDTGESSPIWSVRFMEKRPKANLEVIDGDAQIKELKRISTYHAYEIKVNKNTLFRENTLYFPGWEINSNKKPLDIEFQNMQYRGIMIFNLSKGDHIIEAKFKETKLRMFSNFISVLSLGFLLGISGRRFLKNKV